MSGGLTMVDYSHMTRPCLCLDIVLPSYMSLNKNLIKLSPSMELSSSFLLDSSYRKLQYSTKSTRNTTTRNRRRRIHPGLKIVGEVAGQYEDGFEDVKTQLVNYFTYKAVRTVLHQLYEMNPTKYRWLYDFVVLNKPDDGKRFIRTLVKENQDLAERVMVTRLHLYGQWVKKCDHAQIYQLISDENLELMRERLMETVVWPSDDTNSEMVS
ncbi:chaperonin-like RbcX protein 2, chloroplastic [Impatiens glandulifera]|uniref:chaperonin-like RbcX protein 2, chloroplastic n=1 Tax=Impatiens glandulifera TaxID=253017 RepID=UPI001FB14D4D|nr:chaperonin-like RbcX protein 2, chloroplastic [Impatiens glandulifera]